MLRVISGGCEDIADWSVTPSVVTSGTSVTSTSISRSGISVVSESRVDCKGVVVVFAEVVVVGAVVVVVAVVVMVVVVVVAVVEVVVD